MRLLKQKIKVGNLQLATRRMESTKTIKNLVRSYNFTPERAELNVEELNGVDKSNEAEYPS